jgi:hypothetical protein
MQYAIVHIMSGFVLEKHEASNNTECIEQFLKYHEELGCDTVAELFANYPVYMANLAMIPLN